MRYLLTAITIFPLLSGCLGVGHKGWSDYMDKKIGQKAAVLDPTRFGDSGELIRADYLISGEGFTHITENENGNIVQHWFVSEVLPNFYNNEGPLLSRRGHKEWVGKCKFSYILDPETKIIKSWGIDEGGNPESCRIWP